MVNAITLFQIPARLEAGQGFTVAQTTPNACGLHRLRRNNLSESHV